MIVTVTLDADRALVTNEVGVLIMVEAASRLRPRMPTCIRARFRAEIEHGSLELGERVPDDAVPSVRVPAAAQASEPLLGPGESVR